MRGVVVGVVEWWRGWRVRGVRVREGGGGGWGGGERGCGATRAISFSFLTTWGGRVRGGGWREGGWWRVVEGGGVVRGGGGVGGGGWGERSVVRAALLWAGLSCFVRLWKSE